MTLMSILAALLSGVHGRVLILPLVSLNAVVYIVLTYIRPDRADFHQQARLVNRKQLAWLMLIWLIASILIAVAMLSYLARQPIWIQTQGVAEALASIMGSFVSMLFFSAGVVGSIFSKGGAFGAGFPTNGVDFSDGSFCCWYIFYFYVSTMRFRGLLIK